MTEHMKWWGWGAPDKRMKLESKPAMLAFLRSALGSER